MTGYTQEELENASDPTVFILPEERKEVIENIKKTKNGENLGLEEKTILRKDGTTFPALIMTNPIISENKVIGFRGIVIDNTERKKAQEALNRTMNKLTTVNEKLSVVGSLTRHDVRNKLSVLNGYIYLLKNKATDKETTIKYLTEMDETSKQLLAILDFEKVYEQVGSEELVFVNVDRFFAEACSLVSDFKGLSQKCECDGLEVLADSLLRQLIYNLIDNTLKYGEKTTQIKLYYKKEKNDVLLVYEDNGIGMTEEVRAHLFEKGFGKGTGFGLYMTKRIIDTYEWTIEENGELGVCARFTMKIPQNKFKLQQLDIIPKGK
jgi:PAS domain S-box-containing protein